MLSYILLAKISNDRFGIKHMILKKEKLMWDNSICYYIHLLWILESRLNSTEKFPIITSSVSRKFCIFAIKPFIYAYLQFTIHLINQRIMKLIERICEIFSQLWHSIRGSKKWQPTVNPPDNGNGAHVGDSGNSTSSNADGHPSGNDGPTDQHIQGITPNPIGDGQSDKNPQSTIPKTYTVQTIPFLTSKLNLDYEATCKVPYSILDSVDAKFPIIRAPKRGCEIKLPKIGRSGKRGVCEERLCKMIRDLKLHDFYDDISLFIGNYSKPYEPDIAYIDVQKGIFIDIEIDEPYSGWERKPIHYKTKYGTIDDARNNYFTERGWTVIRFSEKQVYEHPKSCLRRVYQLLHEMDVTITMPKCLAIEADISPDDIWTKEQAARMEQNKAREKMLDIDKFIQPAEAPHTTIEDYPHGQEIEKKIISKRKGSQRIESGQTQSGFIVNPLQPPKDFTSNPDDQRQREAERYEHPQRIATYSQPKTTPSSRGYA